MSAVRQLGLFSATAIVIANMIGTGVFTTSGFLLADLRSPWVVLLAWTVGGVLAALGALCYGALARRFPESGGEYVFLSRTLHPAAGYLAGWVSLLVGFSAPVAAAAYAFGEYTKPILPNGLVHVLKSALSGLASETWLEWALPRALGTALMVLFSVIHALHVRSGAWIQNVAVVFKVTFIVAFIGTASVSMSPAPAPDATPFALAGFAVSLVWISFSYSGWNAAVYIAGEVRDPDRNLPRALILGTAVVTVLYLGLNAVFVLAAPATQLAGKLEVGRVAAEAIGGRTWGTVVAALIAVGLTSSVSSMVMAGPRVYARMAADGYLPRWFRAGDGPPRGSILLQGILACILLWTSTFESLLTYIGFTLSLSTAATVAGLVRLRWREGDRVQVPGWPWTPAVFLFSVVGTLVFAIVQRPSESAVGFLTVLVGVLAWRCQGNGVALRTQSERADQ